MHKDWDAAGKRAKCTVIDRAYRTTRGSIEYFRPHEQLQINENRLFNEHIWNTMLWPLIDQINKLTKKGEI